MNPTSPDPLGVRAASRWVLGRARQVRLGDLLRAVGAIGERPLPAWDARTHYAGPPERTRRALLVLDTINFSFWARLGEEAAGGYLKIAERIRDAYEAGTELEDVTSLRSITGERLGELLGSFPMLEERAAALRELGRHGFDDLVQPTAVGTARALAGAFESYRDTALYDGREVPFMKRAQIVPADLAGAGLESFPDLDALTCFADYKLPQVLRHLDAIEYSTELARRIDGWEELRAGEPAEVEIRAVTVVAVEEIADALRERGRPLRTFEVDWLLWGLAQHTYPMRPHHRTRTRYY